MVGTGQRFTPYWIICLVAMYFAVYTPYAVPALHTQVFVGRWVFIAVPIWLSVSALLRDLTGLTRSLWLRTLWVAADMFVWYLSTLAMSWDGTPVPFVGFLLATEAGLVGWEYYRGLVHWGVSALIGIIAPFLITMSWGAGAFRGYLLPVLPGYLFCYTFVYFGGRMSEEQERAERARQEAVQTRIEAELANQQLREYARQVEEVAALRERNRVAREVHDTIAHGFTSLHMQVELAELLLAQNPAEAANLMVQIKDQVRESLDEVRRSVHALRPAQLEAREGIEAIGQLVAEFGQTTGVQTDLVVCGQLRELPASHELCLYRAVQEGLTNAFRHGHARRARVRIDFAPAQVQICVEDDGAGASGLVAGGMGIVGIRERAAILGGNVEAGTAPTGGFVLQVTLPLAPLRTAGTEAVS